MQGVVRSAQRLSFARAQKTLVPHVTLKSKQSRGELNICAAAADSYAQQSLDPVEKYVFDHAMRSLLL